MTEAQSLRPARRRVRHRRSGRPLQRRDHPEPDRRPESDNPALREWHTNNLGRLPGLKFMRTLWVCDVAGGPPGLRRHEAREHDLGLEEAHRDLKISPDEFDEVAAELARTLDRFQVPEQEKEEVLGAFAAHKGEVTEGYG